jgi:hypothetical protein
VEVVEQIVRDTESSSSPFSYDNDARMIRVYDEVSQEERVYPYAPEIRFVGSSQLTEDSKWLFEASEQDPQTGQADFDGVWVWIFDPQAGRFFRYESLCNRQKPLHLETLTEEPWSFYMDAESGRVHLCENATGRLSSAMPEGAVWMVEQFSGLAIPIAPVLSPDALGVAFIVEDPLSNTPAFHAALYSYEIATDTFNRLGDFDIYTIRNFEGWMSDTVVVFSTREMGEFATQFTYVADVTRPGSMTLAAETPRIEPVYNENPPSIEAVTGAEGLGEPAHCIWSRYHGESGEREQIDLGNLCEPEYGSLQGTGYYRDVEGVHSATATLVAFNPTTGERRDLYTGEIESVEWVSGDERYAILTLDQNGLIDAFPFLPDNQWGLPGYPLLSLVNLTTGETLYRMETSWAARLDDTVGPLSVVVPIHDSLFLAAMVDSARYVNSGYPLTYHAILVTLDNNGVAFGTRIGEIAAIFPGGQRVLLWGDSEHRSLSAYDVVTQDRVPVINDLDTGYFNLAVDAIDDSRLIHVIITPAGEHPYQATRAVTYHIRIP